jgi:hypothetical protein
MRKRIVLAIAAIVMALVVAGGIQNSNSVHGVGYPVTTDGDLLWYRHDGRDDGSPRWVYDSPRKIGNGWNFKQRSHGYCDPELFVPIISKQSCFWRIKLWAS